MYKFLLCHRYLKTRYIALASIISVMLGVATMIVVNSVMSGFTTQMRDRLHAMMADVIIETHSLDGVSDPDLQMDIARQVAGGYIESMSPSVEVYGMMSFNYAGQWITQPIALVGVEPEGLSKVGPLTKFLDSYKTIEKDGKLIRKPLREADQIPTWNLTREAIAYRKEKVERQKWYDQQLNAASDGNEDAEPFNPFQEAAEKMKNETESKEDSKENTKETTKTEIANSDESNVENPFAAAPNAPQEVDPAAPMAGRLYVGIGLMSFRTKDKKTGETKVVMMARPGDDVKISTVTSGRPPSPAHFNATIADVFESGMSEHDSKLVYCNLAELQKVRGMMVEETGSSSITTIKIKLKDYNKAPEAIERLRAAFPSNQFIIRTWEQKQGPLLAAVDVELGILNILLFLIIAVAGFGILAIFFMIVVEKTRDIGILKALGASSRGVMSIFLSYGLALGIVGSGAGVALGLSFVYYINEIESLIAWTTGRKVFDETIYYFPEIPTIVHPSMVLWVALGAMMIAVLASVLPARRASKLHPVSSLRYE